MNPISLVCLCKILLPSPQSHWSATGSRSKKQPTTTWNAQRKTTQPSCWLPKLVRPVSETFQTGSVGNPKTHRDPKLPQNTSRTIPPLNKKSHSTTETFLLKSPSWQELNRQTGLGNRSGQFYLDSREELSPREKLNLPSDRSPDSFHGSKWDFGDSWGTSWATFG
jgi:hypothetical protein